MLYVPSYMSPSGLGALGHSREDLSMPGCPSADSQRQNQHHRNQRHQKQRKQRGGGGGGGGSGGGSNRRSKLVRFESRTSHLRLYRQRQQAGGGGGGSSSGEDEDGDGEAEEGEEGEELGGSRSDIECDDEEEEDDDNSDSGGGGRGGGSQRRRRAGGSRRQRRGRRRGRGSSGGRQFRSVVQASSLAVAAAFHDCHLLGCERVRLNVSGMHFETRLGVLNQHPRTLLGNPQKRAKYFDRRYHEYFFDRHRPTFEAVFNYYLYGGKLKRPPNVTDDIFLSELEFYEIEREVIDAYKKDEGYISETVVLPEHPVKRAIWMLFEYPETSAPAFLIAIISVVFTIASIVLFCAETLHEFKGTHCVPPEMPNFLDPFFVAESACTAWFTIELLVRFMVCPCKKAFMKDIKNAVDLSAIVPYYVTLTNVLVTMSCEGAKSSASLAFLRVVRLIRIFKLTKHSADLQVLVLTFRASIEGLGLFLVALIVCILLFSSTIYYVESEVKGSQIESIPDAFWWAVITMCTVGYGDKVPKGPLGKIVGSVCAVAGVLTLAIPVPIITENFNKFYTHKTGRGRH